MLSHINTPFWVKDYQNLSLGVVLKINAGHGDGTDSLLRFAPASDGTYYVAAAVYANSDTGTYSLNMSSQVATEDIVSNLKQAGALTIGTPVNGVLEDEEGYDVYTITLSPGDYRLTVLPGSGDDPVEDSVVFVDTDQFFLDGLLDDDGGTDSMLEFSSIETVETVIAVGGYDPGAYVILIELF